MSTRSVNENRRSGRYYLIIQTQLVTYGFWTQEIRESQSINLMCYYVSFTYYCGLYIGRPNILLEQDKMSTFHWKKLRWSGDNQHPTPY